MTALGSVEAPARLLADEVTPAEHARLLGLPRARTLEGELADRAAAARSWYAERGRPWAAARKVAIEAIAGDSLIVEGGATFTSRALADRLRSGEAHALVSLAVSAGTEVDAETRRLWQDGKPDEAYFLDRFGAAVTERLVHWATVWFCRRSEPLGETLLPHLSPGCGGWDFEEQASLMTLLTQGETSLGPLSMLESGMLTPKNSLLAALGVTKRQISPSPADACRACDLSPCSFRRVPYRGVA